MAGVVDTTYSFVDNDLITSAKLNNIIDQTTFTNDAIQGATLEVSGGKLKVRSANITSNELAANAVVTTKITDLNVTTGKLADSAVTTVKINDAAVTTAKITDANVTGAKLSGAQTGSAPVFGARAYGSFDGSAISPITPVKAGNITSITRTATGAWTVVMATPMDSANYCVVANATHATGVTFGSNCYVTITNSSTFQIQTGQISSGSGYNSTNINFAVFA